MNFISGIKEFQDALIEFIRFLEMRGVTSVSYLLKLTPLYTIVHFLSDSVEFEIQIPTNH